jgi:hypothetical protein
MSRILKALPIVYQKTPFELEPEDVYKEAEICRCLN